MEVARNEGLNAFGEPYRGKKIGGSGKDDGHQRITGLNPFGQPWRGKKISGVGAAERRVGKAWSRLSSAERSEYGNQANFAGAKLDKADVAMEQHQQQQAVEAMRRGRAAAQSEMAGGSAPGAGMAAAEKREGTLVGDARSGYRWRSGEELTAEEEARKAARKKDPYGYGKRVLKADTGRVTRPLTMVAMDAVA